MIDLVLTEQNQKEFEKRMTQLLDKAVEHFEKDLATIRTGRAHPSLVEKIQVQCYGGPAMELRHMAGISTPEARLLVIEPWDKSVIGDVERAIQHSDLGVNPVNDGNVISIALPEMSSARRDELTKLLGKKLEDTRITIRNVRKDFNNLIKESLKKKTISEDHNRRLTEASQKLTDNYIKKCEDFAGKKEKDIKGLA
jgi:ribosome recycling factor